MDVLELFSENYSQEKHEEMTLRDYLSACRDNTGFYASAAERMITAIGEPELIMRSARRWMRRGCRMSPGLAPAMTCSSACARRCSQL